MIIFFLLNTKELTNNQLDKVKSILISIDKIRRFEENIFLLCPVTNAKFVRWIGVPKTLFYQ